MDGRIHGAEKALECLLVAMNGSSDHLLTTSACHPTSDVTAVGRESPKLNIPLEFGRGNLK
jgi:hypothetical protein